MTESASPAGANAPPALPPCNLCGAVVVPLTLRCSGCASTPRARVTRHILQSIPMGMLAWRRAALPGETDGIGVYWFSRTPAAWPYQGGDPLDFAALPATAAALAMVPPTAWSRRAILYLTPPAEAVPVPAADQGIAALRAGLPGWTLLGVAAPDPCSAVPTTACLAFRSERDAVAWARQLRSWCGAASLLPEDLAARASLGGGLPALRQELARWEAEGLDCPLWWRDDDLIGDGPALRRLAALSAHFNVPALMAVIPAQADPALAACTADMPTLSFCQHGWNHVSHEGEGRPKSEFGATRAPADAERDVASGVAWMRECFGVRFLPVFVPPWNNIAPALAARLPALGLHGLSQYVGMPPLCAAGLLRVDTHTDIVDWGIKGGARDPDELVQRLVAMLQLRMEGKLHEPIGILSHHRAMGEGSWAFLEQLFTVLAEYACVRWLDARTLFASPPPADSRLQCAA